MNQNHEFKDIKDVDLSKLEGKERYTCLVGGVATILTGNSLKLGIFNVETILLPCSPIVETDKLREGFIKLCNYDPKSKLRKDFELDATKIFDFFLPHLSVSKGVEVSDEDIEKELNEIKGVYYAYSLISVLQRLVTGCEYLLHDKGYDGGDYEEIEHCVARAKDTISFLSIEPMRDKQGIAPKEVEEKK